MFQQFFSDTIVSASGTDRRECHSRELEGGLFVIGAMRMVLTTSKILLRSARDWMSPYPPTTHRPARRHAITWHRTRAH